MRPVDSARGGVLQQQANPAEKQEPGSRHNTLLCIPEGSKYHYSRYLVGTWAPKSRYYTITWTIWVILLMDKILHDPKDPKLWELWYIPYYGSCRIMSINRMRRVRFRMLQRSR